MARPPLTRRSSAFLLTIVLLTLVGYAVAALAIAEAAAASIDAGSGGGHLVAVGALWVTRTGLFVILGGMTLARMRTAHVHHVVSSVLVAAASAYAVVAWQYPLDVPWPGPADPSTTDYVWSVLPPSSPSVATFGLIVLRGAPVVIAGAAVATGYLWRQAAPASVDARSTTGRHVTIAAAVVVLLITTAGLLAAKEASPFNDGNSLSLTSAIVWSDAAPRVLVPVVMAWLVSDGSRFTRALAVSATALTVAPAVTAWLSNGGPAWILAAAAATLLAAAIAFERHGLARLLTDDDANSAGWRPDSLATHR